MWPQVLTSTLWLKWTLWSLLKCPAAPMTNSCGSSTCLDQIMASQAIRLISPASTAHSWEQSGTYHSLSSDKVVGLIYKPGCYSLDSPSPKQISMKLIMEHLYTYVHKHLQLYNTGNSQTSNHVHHTPQNLFSQVVGMQHIQLS